MNLVFRTFRSPAVDQENVLIYIMDLSFFVKPFFRSDHFGGE